MIGQIWTKLLRRWNIYSPSQRSAVIAFLVMLVILPSTTILVQRSTENRSRASVRNIPITAPITNPNPRFICTDSDGGRNYYQKGEVTARGGIRRLPPPQRIESTPSSEATAAAFIEDMPSYEGIASDKCNETVNQLTEYYCDNGQISSENYNCPKGCTDGACVGPPDNNKISWKTPTVSLEADNFFISVNGKLFMANQAVNFSLHSDRGSPTYTTLESTWKENGVEMRLYMYFTADHEKWWLSELRIYNGKDPGDWYYHRFTDNELISGQIGNAISSADLSINTFANNNTTDISGVVQFNNIRLQAFTNQSPAVPCTDSDGGKDYFTKGTAVGLAGDEVLTTREDFCWPKNQYRDGYDYVAEWFCWKNPNNGREYAINTNEKCLYGCKNGACINPPTISPSLPTPVFKLSLANPSQTIKVGDVFDLNILINTAGQKSLGGDALLSFDSSKIVVDPQQVRTGNFFNILQSKATIKDKILVSSWQNTSLNPTSTTFDSLFATITIKAQAEGVSNLSFECSSGIADSNIWDANQTDIIRCPLEPLTLNIVGNSPTNVPATPAPVTGILQPSPTSLIYPQSYPTPTFFVPSPTQFTLPTITNHPTPFPTSDLQVAFPPTISPTPLESVVFNREIPTATPMPVISRAQTSGNFLVTLFANIFNLIFGRR